MLAISLVSLVIAAMSVYFSYTIKDEVFRVGIGFASLLFILITIVCSPWLLKLAIIIVSIPLLLDFVKIWSVEHFNEYKVADRQYEIISNTVVQQFLGIICRNFCKTGETRSFFQAATNSSSGVATSNSR